MRKTSLFASLMCVLISTSALGVGGNMGGTDPNGSPEKPYLIEDLADFDTFADPNNAATYWAAGVHTKLTTDIDLSGRTYTTAVIAPDTDNTNNYWVFDGPPFAGVFGGNNFVISNLTIDDVALGNYFLGLFGFVDSVGEIRNLAIENIDIDGNKYIGGIAGRLYGTITNCHTSGILNAVNCGGGVVGYNDSGMIDNCYSSALIIADDTAGGLVGDNSGTITNCSATGSATATNYGFVGGLVGESYGSVINCYATGDVIVPDGHGGGLIGYNTNSVINCYATGSVSGYRDAGGLAGQNRGTISACFSTGSVESTGYNIGGLVGSNNMGTIQNCFSLGDVTGDDKVGGFVGYNAYIIENSYCTGRIIGNTYVGGICGYQKGNFAVIRNCFWDMETSGMAIGYNLDPAYPGTVTNVVGETTAEMMTESTFTGWDFSTPVWMMLRELEDYPRLAWQEVFAGDIAGLYGADMVDFAYLANYWGQDCDNPECDQADIDESGDVGLPDLAAVADDWLK